MRKTIETLCLCVVAGLILFWLFRLVTDFKTTLVVTIVLVIAGLVKSRFFGKD